MCVKLSLGDLNLDPCPQHPTSIYTCGVTTALRVRGDIHATFRILLNQKLQMVLFPPSLKTNRGKTMSFPLDQLHELS